MTGPTDWPAIFFCLSSEFGWTPGQIRNLTVDEAQVYLDQIDSYRDKVPRQDMTLAEIKAALFAFFGIEEKTDKPEEKMAKAGMAGFKITKAEKQAWINAGMPNIGKFLKKYRRESKCQEKQA